MIPAACAAGIIQDPLSYLIDPLLFLLMQNTTPIRNAEPAIRAALRPAFIPSPVLAATGLAAS